MGRVGSIGICGDGDMGAGASGGKGANDVFVGMRGRRLPVAERCATDWRDARRGSAVETRRERGLALDLAERRSAGDSAGKRRGEYRRSRGCACERAPDGIHSAGNETQHHEHRKRRVGVRLGGGADRAGPVAEVGEAISELCLRLWQRGRVREQSRCPAWTRWARRP